MPPLQRRLKSRPVASTVEREYHDINPADLPLLATIQGFLPGFISSIRKRNLCAVQRDGKPDLHVRGNVVDHEYKIHLDRDVIAEVSKRWFRISDTYGVEVAPGQNDVLILAVTVVLDMMAHPSS